MWHHDDPDFGRDRHQRQLREAAAWRMAAALPHTPARERIALALLAVVARLAPMTIEEARMRRLASRAGEWPLPIIGRSQGDGQHCPITARVLACSRLRHWGR